MNTSKTREESDIKFNFYPLIALAIGLGISLFNVYPILFKDNVVQDDFRQSFFWVWKYWDPELFRKSFLADIYQSHIIRTPIVNGIFHLGPLFTVNLIFFSKLLAIFIGTISTLFAYLYFHQLTKDKYLSLIYTFFMSSIFWYTDHVSNACTRCYLWVGLYAYLYFKELGKNHLASLVCFILLLMSPFAFLLCLGMEGLNIILNWKTQKRDLLGFFVNLFSVAFLYLFVFKDIKTMGKGHTFTVSEMKLIPEFNTGGRHPIFDSSFKDGSWFTSTHWGLPVGSFGIYHILALAVFILTISVYLYFNKNKAVKILKSNTIILFYSSIILYILAQALFPLLYMPNRYIAVPWLILVILILFLLLFELVSYLNKHKPYLSKTFYITVSLICFLGIYLTQDLKIKNPGFLSMNNDTKTVIEKLPKDSIIAGHPGLHDLTMIPAITKREVFIDRERSVAYSIDILNEIRRRTIESFKMTYASNKKELIDLMKSNNVTHIIAHKKYYKKIYLDNPKYYEPYSKPLKEIIEKNRNKGFYLDSLLKENGMGFIVLSTEELKE